MNLFLLRNRELDSVAADAAAREPAQDVERAVADPFGGAFSPQRSEIPLSADAWLLGRRLSGRLDAEEAHSAEARQPEIAVIPRLEGFAHLTGETFLAADDSPPRLTDGLERELVERELAGRHWNLWNLRDSELSAAQPRGEPDGIGAASLRLAKRLAAALAQSIAR